MVRESTTDKKRKKSATEGVIFQSPAKIVKDEIYSVNKLYVYVTGPNFPHFQNAISFEEDEAVTRSTKTDSKLFREKCSELKKLCGSVASLKEQNDDVTQVSKL